MQDIEKDVRKEVDEAIAKAKVRDCLICRSPHKHCLLFLFISLELHGCFTCC